MIYVVSIIICSTNNTGKFINFSLKKFTTVLIRNNITIWEVILNSSSQPNIEEITDEENKVCTYLFFTRNFEFTKFVYSLINKSKSEYQILTTENNIKTAFIYLV